MAAKQPSRGTTQQQEEQFDDEDDNACDAVSQH
jgi:hypothetical protein